MDIDSDPVATVVTDFLVKLTAHALRGLRVQLYASDEVHLFLEPVLYDRSQVALLLELVGQSGADEIDWRDDHLRLWWD